MREVSTPKEIVSKPKRRRSPSPPTPMLRRSGHLPNRSTAPPTHTSSPIIIEDEDEEVEVPKAMHCTPCDPQIHGWITAFGEVLMKSFDSDLQEWL